MITQSRQVAKRHRDHLDTLSSGFQGRSPWLFLVTTDFRDYAMIDNLNVVPIR
jgi:hypothetical protein